MWRGLSPEPSTGSRIAASPPPSTSRAPLRLPGRRSGSRSGVGFGGSALADSGWWGRGLPSTTLWRPQEPQGGGDFRQAAVASGEMSLDLFPGRRAGRMVQVRRHLLGGEVGRGRGIAVGRHQPRRSSAGTYNGTASGEGFVWDALEEPFCDGAASTHRFGGCNVLEGEGSRVALTSLPGYQDSLTVGAGWQRSFPASMADHAAAKALAWLPGTPCVQESQQLPLNSSAGCADISRGLLQNQHLLGGIECQLL